MDGWIKIHRKITEWEWYTDANACRLFFHLLLIANHEPHRWRGIEINAGEIVTGRHSLSEQTGLSEKAVRTALDKLEGTSEVAIKSTNKYSIISIVKWSDYQMMGQQNGQQGASKNPGFFEESQKIGPAKRPANNCDIPYTEQPLSLPVSAPSASKTAHQGPAKGQQGATNKNEKKGKNIYSLDFAEAWKLYPRKTGKEDAHKVYLKTIKEGTPHDTIIRGVERFNAYHRTKGTAIQYIPEFARWMRGKRWNDDYSVSADGLKWYQTPANRMPSEAGG